MAFSSPASPGTPIFPALILFNIEYEGEEWIREIRVPFVESLSASEVQSLVCVKESRDQVGTYIGNIHAYQREWDIRLVRWPDGNVLGGKSFLGENPPYSITLGTSKANYGEPPKYEFREWLFSALGDTTILLHGDNVTSVAFSPDGKTLASGGEDGTVRLWDVVTGQTVRTLTGHTGYVDSLAFSPDGKTLASGSGETPELPNVATGTVRLWDVATGQEIRALTGYSYVGVHSMAFSPDGRTLAAASSGEVRLWDVAMGEVVHVLEDPAVVSSVAFSPDGKTLASGNTDNMVTLWDAATGQVVRILTGHTNGVQSVVFSPDGKTLASGGQDGTVRLWDAATGQVLRTLAGHRGWVNSVAFSPDGKLLASSGLDRTVKLWDVATGQDMRIFTGHSELVYSVAFSPDGKTLASGSADETVKLWDLVAGRSAAIPQATDTPELTSTPTSIPHGAFRPPAGTIVQDTGQRAGLGELIIENGTQFDGVVVLAHSKDEPVTSVYIRSEESFTLTGVRDGTYRLFFTMGEDWDGDRATFTENRRFQVFEDTFTFTTTSTATGKQYTIMTVTLHPVVSGTAETEALGEDEFPDLSSR